MTEGGRIAAKFGCSYEITCVAEIDAAIAEAKKPLIEALAVIETLPLINGITIIMQDIAHKTLVADKERESHD